MSEAGVILAAMVEVVAQFPTAVSLPRDLGKQGHQFISTCVDNADSDTSGAVCAENN